MDAAVVGVRSKHMRHALILVVLTAAAAHAAGPPGKAVRDIKDTKEKYRAPRTKSGRPDLQGVWNFSSDVPLERPLSAPDKTLFTREEIQERKAAKAKAFGAISKMIPVEGVAIDWLDYSGRIENLRTSLIRYPENGRLPKLVDGVRRVPGTDEIIEALAEANGTIPPVLAAFVAGAGRRDGPEDFGASERCLFGGGPPFLPDLDNNYVQIIQADDHVVLLTERRARIVPLNGSPHLNGIFRSWAGDSRGYWDGETLVVETRNFNSRTRSFAGAGNSSVDKAVTERFTRVADKALEYEATVIDAKTFQDKIVLAFPMAKVEARIYEAACHEGNYSMRNMLSAARTEEQRGR
jgi:hypothetical protein